MGLEGFLNDGSLVRTHRIGGRDFAKKYPKS